MPEVGLATRLYRSMVRIREFEERVAALLEKNEIQCPTHLCTGQEAIAAGICEALEPSDYVLGNHRSHGHYLAKGGDMSKLMAELYGKATGCSSGRGGSMHLIAREAGLLGTVPIVSATVPMAVGAGVAAQQRGESRVSVGFFGDGSMEEGTVHESLNLAALMKAPVLFVCENNLYSSHMHISERRAKDNLVQSAEAQGMPGVVLDGNDAFAMFDAAVEAVSRARSGQGPTFMECRTYRWRGHVGPSWDTDVGLMRRDELHQWLPLDPIKRAKEWLQSHGVAEATLTRTELDARQEVESAVQFASRSPYPDPRTLLDHVFRSSGFAERGVA